MLKSPKLCIAALIIISSFIPGIILGDRISPLLGWLIPAIALFCILFYGSFFINSNFYVNAVCSGKTDRKTIAITFDDGPDEIYTRKILGVLGEHDVKATFFCIGRKIEENREILKEIVSQGHLVGNHSYSHSHYLNFLSKRKIVKDMRKTHELIKEITNTNIKYFRPPNAITNHTLKAAIDALGYTVIGWSVRPFDTVLRSKDLIVRKLKKGLKPGGIIFLHDTNGNTEAILREFLNYAIQNGYRVIPLDSLTGIKAYD